MVEGDGALEVHFGMDLRGRRKGVVVVAVAFVWMLEMVLGNWTGGSWCLCFVEREGGFGPFVENR
jgi:hypothetical protein